MQNHVLANLEKLCNKEVFFNNTPTLGISKGFFFFFFWTNFLKGSV